jgi:maltooligosyltrehalose trehalohydrolase
MSEATNSEVRVWAPFATVVELEASGRRTPMRAADGGWWAHDAPDGEYWFVVDGSPLPDPRSRRQRYGPDGPSQRDTGSFPWTDDGWRGIELADAVIYELHVGTFSPEGTFAGVTAELDHLVALGVNAIEVMPIATFAGRRGWGYDGVDLYAAFEPYGGPDGFRRLVDACHRRGIAVVLDVVYNHLGPVGNVLHRFGPYFTDKHTTPWGAAVNVDDAGSDEVRRFIVDNALMWVRDFHVDGLRLDAVHAIVDTSPVHILRQLANEVHAAADELGRRVWVIAESDLNDPALVTRPADGGHGLDAVWSDDFHHALHVALTGERTGYYADFTGLADLARALRGVYVYSGRLSPSRGRVHGRPVGDLPRTRFLGYAQNHDQIGNRATGERLCHLVPPRRAEIAAALVLTAPFVPLLFQGEEWAASAPFQYFTDVADPAVGQAIRDGRRSEFAAFGWRPEDVPDPQDRATFERSKLDWGEIGHGSHRRMLEWYRGLIALRAAHAELRDGAVPAVRHDADAGWLVVERGSFTIAVNLGRAQTVPGVAGEVVLANDHAAARRDGGLRLDADAVAVLRRQAS